MLRGTTGSRLYGGTRTIALLAFVLVIIPTRAHAYTDPGSGMLIWQGLLAAVSGALVYVCRLVQSLRGRRPVKETPDPQESLRETRQ